MSAPSLIERVKTSLVALKMPRALEVLDVTLRGIERGEIGAVEAIDALFTEELATRENRRVRMAVQMARLSAIKTLAGFDFAFQPSLDRNRILALAGLQFFDRAEALHLIGPPGTGKTHLSLALGVEAVKAGRSVYFSSLADIVATLAKPNVTALFANGSATTAASRCSSSMRSATSPSRPEAAISSSSSSTPAMKRAR
jgi:DNA replication protein DnaC